MSNQNPVNESPAYVVLYHPSSGNEWSARVVDLDCQVITSGHCRLTKDPNAYAVLYTPQPDKKWLADILDIPGCSASRPEIAQARVAVKYLAKRTLASYSERGEQAPRPVTICYYTRPTDFQMYQGREITILEAVAEAVIEAVTRHRRERGKTPQPVSVCGYVSLSAQWGEDS